MLNRLNKHDTISVMCLSNLYASTSFLAFILRHDFDKVFIAVRQLAAPRSPLCI